jgi:lysine-specific demethylase 8
MVEERAWDSLSQHEAGAPGRPLLVKGAVRAWPAWTRWSFDQLAELRYPDGKEAVGRFQQGLVEQGSTQPLPVLPVAPYLRELAGAARNPVPDWVGLLPETRRKTLAPGEPFYLNWAHLQSFEPNWRYLADWPVLQEFPALRRDFTIRTLWPGHRWCWEYMFVGPANTVTGLHQDIHDNWFCQIRGTKEILLIPPEHTPHMCVSGKYNLGSVLSEINISKLDRPGREAAEFAQTHGFYSRVQAGDALYIPKNTWHTVVALEPSISLAVFGLTALEVVTVGAWAEFKHLLHRLKLYRWRNCVCHNARTRSREETKPLPEAAQEKAAA